MGFDAGRIHFTRAGVLEKRKHGRRENGFGRHRVPIYPPHGLQSFCVPASVASIGRQAFTLCTSLCELTFEGGSRLTEIQDMAFCSCTSLKTISIPVSVRSMRDRCLDLCEVLTEVIFPSDSQLVMLGAAVFRECSRLSSLFIPSSVEEIGVDCFHECFAMETMTLGAPSRLRVLKDVPLCWRGFKEIPDSVKCLCVAMNWRRSYKCTLVFSVESSLERIETPRHAMPSRCFLGVSSRNLKRIRSHLEFDPQ
jgi:hypothetical protein